MPAGISYPFSFQYLAAPGWILRPMAAICSRAGATLNPDSQPRCTLGRNSRPRFEKLMRANLIRDGSGHVRAHGRPGGVADRGNVLGYAIV